MCPSYRGGVWAAAVAGCGLVDGAAEPPAAGRGGQPVVCGGGGVRCFLTEVVGGDGGRNEEEWGNGRRYQVRLEEAPKEQGRVGGRAACAATQAPIFWGP